MYEACNQPDSIPVLQLPDLEALEAAGRHLKKQNFDNRIVPFADLAKD
jgi:hypothetical protein